MSLSFVGVAVVPEVWLRVRCVVVSWWCGKLVGAEGKRRRREGVGAERGEGGCILSGG